MILKINGLTLALGEGESLLHVKVSCLLQIPASTVVDVEVMRRSLDARRARPPRFVYLLRVRLAEGIDWPGATEPQTSGIGVSVESDVEETDAAEKKTRPTGNSGGRALSSQRPVIVGCGPAGLFAALTLAEKGIPALLLERGKAVPERIADVEAFWERRVLNAESNVHFGEGGAGTFSDGKLTSRSNNPLTTQVKRVLVDMGAPPEVLVEARPHIGTDRLRDLLVNFRKRLTGLGTEIRFGARVTDFIIEQGGIVAVIVDDCEEIKVDKLILAIGQSAAETYGKLAERGVELAQKPFAMGLRVEHPQELINTIQYGSWAGHPDLPPADYYLTAKLGALDRSCYSFCMCPGGRVIGCSSAKGGVVTNGMSSLHRDSPWANSAVVVTVNGGDFGKEGPLAGLDFRSHWEERAFLAGGSDYSAPAQRLTDFLSGEKGSGLNRNSFSPGVKAADMNHVLPLFVAEGLKIGFAEFERKMPGFITGEAVLIGVETRTSSPVRITRRADGRSVNISGLYPCGEGAGYAGGIISSALDGIRAAERLLESLAAS